MKQKYTITIADVQMNIITDEAPEAVETVVGILDRKMREISMKSGNRCPKNEAALLCALDYCAERTKLQETVNKLEAERAGTDVEALNAEIAKRGEELEDIAGRLTYSETQREALQNELDTVNSRLREALMSSDGTAAAKAVITKMLEQFRNNFKKSYLTKHRAYMAEKYPDAPELSVYELLTLASILEKEGRAEERERISAVFYNRLTNPQHEGIEGKLESNATTQYALRHDGYDVSLEFGDFEVNYETPYNSYKYAGLPPTPISTPALDSINAALYPVEQFDFYFFVATNSGYSFFANTLEEHKINIERAKNGEEAEPPYPEDLEEDDYA